jgi:catechol 2,3-dioxygenase-like lactoylglutathione lyase family enzyme
MSPPATAMMSHIGICTRDLEQSLRFYTEALGFTLDRTIDEIAAPFDAMMELPGMRCRVHYIKHGGFTLELIGLATPTVTGSSERRPMNQLGFTHMTLIVPDLDAAIARVEQYGGRAHAETRVDSAFGPMLFCTDPNGVRVELIEPRSSES